MKTKEKDATAVYIEAEIGDSPWSRPQKELPE